MMFMFPQSLGFFSATGSESLPGIVMLTQPSSFLTGQLGFFSCSSIIPIKTEG